jgi:hypothetical protein
VLWAAGAVFVLACGREPPPARSDDSPVRTDSTAFWTDSVVYHLVRDERGWGARIGYRFRNLAADTVYAVNCNGATSVAVERRVGDGWVTFWAPMLNMCLSPPIAIPPGEVLDASLSLWGAPPGGNVGPEYSDTTFTGRYRLNWWNLVFHYDPDSPGFGDTVPLKYRVSNEFELRLRR